MTVLELESACAGALLRADGRFEAGLSVVLGDEPNALANLVAVAAGAQPPARGQIRFDGALGAPPDVRRRIASLLAYEHLPPAPSVERSVAAVAAARADPRSARALLEAFALQDLLPRSPADLDADELRAVMLALALGHEAARYVVLYEPLQVSRRPTPQTLRALLVAKATGGATVLVATTRPETARFFGGRSFRLAHGILRLANDASGRRDDAGILQVHADDADRLAVALASEPSVSAVHPTPHGWPFTLSVEGPELDGLARAVARAARSAGVRVEALVPADSRASSFSHAAPAPHAIVHGAPAAGAEPVAAWRKEPARPDETAARPPDQSVVMPTEFADPTRPKRGGTEP